MSETIRKAKTQREIEAALKESEELYRVLYEEAPNAYVSVGTDGRLLHANNRAVELFGYRLDELIGKPVFELYADTPNGKDRAQIVFNKFLAGEEIVNEEMEMCRADGRRIWISLSVRPIFDEKGRVVASRSSVIDITERKEADTKLAYLASFPELNPYPVLELDGAGAIKYLNPATKVLFPDLLKRGKKHPFLARLENLVERLKREKKYHLTREIQIDGSWYEQTVACVPSSDGCRIYAKDITERKKFEQIKDEFIGLVSHELRTPLTVISGSLRTAVSDGVSPDDMRDLIQNAIEGAASLESILENMLELSRYQADRLKLQIEAVSVPKITDKVIKALKAQSVGQNFCQDFPEDLPLVRADPTRVERIIYNLLENATKYSPERSQIAVFARHEGDFVVTGVSDQGKGISVDEQRRLFLPFSQIGVRPSGTGGTGLGLVVCRRLVEAHGGHIWVESEAGTSSTFYFSLPINKKAV